MQMLVSSHAVHMLNSKEMYLLWTILKNILHLVETELSHGLSPTVHKTLHLQFHRNSAPHDLGTRIV